MRYFGGKYRYAKEISNEINKIISNMDYVEPFCGGCNVISNVLTNGQKYAYDKHSYLISMWQEVMNDWIPPTSISEQDYKYYKQNQDEFPHIAGFVGFACSFASKWWGGYARDKTQGKNYAQLSCNTTLRKREGMIGTIFECKDFTEVTHKNALIYCDPPYKGTTQYCKKILGSFDYDKFLDWTNEQAKDNIVLVSEYKHNVPENATIIWEKETNTKIRNKDDKEIKTIEVLYKVN